MTERRGSNRESRLAASRNSAALRPSRTAADRFSLEVVVGSVATVLSRGLCPGPCIKGLVDTHGVQSFRRLARDHPAAPTVDSAGAARPGAGAQAVACPGVRVSAQAAAGPLLLRRPASSCWPREPVSGTIGPLPGVSASSPGVCRALRRRLRVRHNNWGWHCLRRRRLWRERRRCGRRRRRCLRGLGRPSCRRRRRAVIQQLPEARSQDLLQVGAPTLHRRCHEPVGAQHADAQGLWRLA
mmetsp:Transcript_73544/g.203021  ORF Transcript_73544/g.203021 Transcript_73544/m.203021 type:complete len:241 (-) Transcript_73544:1262-1984(-)